MVQKIKLLLATITVVEILCIIIAVPLYMAVVGSVDSTNHDNTSVTVVGSVDSTNHDNTSVTVVGSVDSTNHDNTSVTVVGSVDSTNHDNTSVTTAQPNPARRACIEVGHSPLEQTDDWKTFTSALESYKLFHDTRMKRLKQLSAQFDANRKSQLNATEQVRTLTWSCDNSAKCAGLGDQFHRIQFVLLLAMISDRVLTLFWNDENLKTMKYLEPNQIDWNFYDERLGMHKEHNLKVSHFLYFGVGQFSKLAELLKSDVPHITISHELTVTTADAIYYVLQVPYIRNGLVKLGIRNQLTFSGEGEIFLGGEIFRYLLKFSSDVISRVEKAQIQLGIHNKKYLAIHLRTGFIGTSFQEDVPPRFRKAYSKDTWERILRGSLEIADKRIALNSSVYFATDSYEAKEWAMQYSKRVKVLDMKLQHVALLESLTDNTTRRDIDGFMATWVDWLLLARAHIFTHGMSGFALFAGRFCSIPPSRQIDFQRLLK